MFKFIGISLLFGAAAFFLREMLGWHLGDDSIFKDGDMSVWFLIGELIGGIGVQTMFGLFLGMVVFVVSHAPRKVTRAITTSTITTIIVTSLMLLGAYAHRTERLSVDSLNLRGTL
ncbi:hypothetical protein HFN60_34505 [Rhizobium leguminosarum]|uniref:hypothetical protein n=1 Tax=Rhizobium leguminosarum TaxID=384 RepID=UPI001C961907|nr:hypothetical protein [Rhizobium leguminosarum]MBY5820689.1 hypothetical protein [Rhizobium leguminosarum]